MTDLILGVADQRADWGVTPAGTLREGPSVHRWREDVRLMAELGIEAYRFPISWPRVLAEGSAFYLDVVGTLQAAGIQSVVTLHDGELPRALEDAGGWADRATAHAFADHARAMARELGSCVSLWTTLDDPWSTAFLGHASGHRDRSDAARALAAAHHLNLAHGLATMAIRDENPDSRVSVALGLHVTRPEDEQDSAHLEAVSAVDLVANHIFLGPMLEGSCPVDLLARTRHLTDWSFVLPGDLSRTRQRLDALGVTLHATRTVRPGPPAAGGRLPPSPWVGVEGVEFLTSAGQGGGNRETEGLHDLLRALGGVYPDVPLMVLGNTSTAADSVEVADGGGMVRDGRRIEWVGAELAEVERAIADGIDVRGYFLSSLLDAVGGTDGVVTRSGIVRVDAAGDRRPKESARWYADVIARRRAARAEPEPPARRRGVLQRLLRRGS